MHFISRLFSGKNRTAYKANTAGNIAMYFALSLSAIAMLIGGSLDLSRANNQKAKLRDIMDGAILAAISQGSTPNEMINLAKSYFNADVNWRKANGEISTKKFWVEENVLYGEATAKIPTTLLSLANIPTISYNIRVGAIRDNAFGPICFLTMHPTRVHTLEMKDTVSVSGPDCHIFGNSSHPFDVVDPHTPSNFLTGKSVQAVGYGHHYIENVTPPLVRAAEPIPDPFDKIKIPDGSGACNYTGMKISSGKPTTLSPGIYCKGLKIEKGGKATLKPGLYVIKDGDFSVNQGHLTGSDVTIALADSKTHIDWANAKITLNAPKKATADNPYNGIAILGVRKSGAGTSSGGGTLNSHDIEDSQVDIHGVVYLPNGEFYWKNKGNFKPKHKWTAWIVDGVSWSGSGTVHYNFSPENSDIPVPQALFSVPLMATKLEHVSDKKFKGEILVWDHELQGSPRLIE